MVKHKEKEKDNQVNLIQCNPATLKSTRTTCLPIDMLLRLRDKWNTLHPSHAIPTSSTTKENLWIELRNRLKNQYNCETEYCAVQKLGVDGSEQYFRPKKPEEWKKKPTEWHDSVTLSSVMEQYENADPSFEFIGPTPIDFDSDVNGLGTCILDELCNLNLTNMKNGGTRHIGIIFNLDKHDKPGSHWVCAYIDLVNLVAYYYDSYGMRPCPQITRLLRRCYDQGCDQIVWNDIRHQRKGSECGTYCLYTIISLMSKKSFYDICKNRVDDDTMNSTRDLLFATENPSKKAITDASPLFIVN